MSTELLPCPFCGAPAEDFNPDGDMEGYTIRCSGKGAIFGADSSCCPIASFSFPDHSEACKSWNTRSTPTPPVEPVARFAGYLGIGRAVVHIKGDHVFQLTDPLYATPVEPVKEADVSAIRDAALEEAAREFDRRDRGAGGFYDPHEPAEIIRALRGGTP
jgi:hypothetical protein